MKLRQILLIAAIVFLKVNSSWGQDANITEISSAADGPVPTESPTALEVKNSSTKGVVTKEDDHYYGHRNPPKNPDSYTEVYDAETDTCKRTQYNKKKGSSETVDCPLSTGGIFAVLLGILVIFLLAALAYVYLMAKKGKFSGSGQNGADVYNASGGPMMGQQPIQSPNYIQSQSPMQSSINMQSPVPMQAPIYMSAPGGSMPMQGSAPMQAQSPMQSPPTYVQAPAQMQAPFYMLAPGAPMPVQGSPPMQAPTGPQ